jgi:hypothetical protein
MIVAYMPRHPSAVTALALLLAVVGEWLCWRSDQEINHLLLVFRHLNSGFWQVEQEVEEALVPRLLAS